MGPMLRLTHKKAPPGGPDGALVPKA
jgi:hypothetical protein